MAAAENRDALTVGSDSVDIQGIAADHEIDMDHAVIESHGDQFIFAVFFEVADTAIEASADGEVASGIFIVKGIPEEDTGLIDG